MRRFGKNVAQTTTNPAHTSATNGSDLVSGHTVLFDGFKNYSVSSFDFGAASIRPWGTRKTDIGVANPNPVEGQPALFFMNNDAPPYTNSDNKQGINADAAIALIQGSNLEDAKCQQGLTYSLHYFRPELNHLYCVRTWDGQHYAKIKVTELAGDHIGFDWIYQSKGGLDF